MPTPNKPDYIVGALDKGTGQKASNIGAGWKNANGSVTVKLNAFTQLVGSDSLLITLFPNTPKPQTSKKIGYELDALDDRPF